MKRMILVLDAFTNGHEAANVFVKEQGWPEDECEIVFGGTHFDVFRRLIEGPSYAVIPIHNSIAGDVREVTEKITAFREAGYILVERGRIELQINHCLLASPGIFHAQDLKAVISHQKALEQCGSYLTKIGVNLPNRRSWPSTGGAAKEVARLGASARVGAIAPKTAADEYGLRILAERIQDVQDNKTTFLLLENQANVEKVIVGIIGINGSFGCFLQKFFEDLGCTVIGSDIQKPNGLSNAEVVTNSDAVIFSIPIEVTPQVIRNLLPFTRENQLLMDVTSVKRPAMAAMAESRAQIIGLHPMFRPVGTTFDGQTIVVCPERLTDPHWKTWVVNMLAATRSKIKWSTAKEHDEYMAIVQVIPHLANLVSACLLTERGASVKESLEYTSPIYLVMISLIGRLVDQNSSLYTQIFFENPKTIEILSQRIKIEQRLLEMIQGKDDLGLEKLFVRSREHFGPEETEKSNELFTRIFAVLSTLRGKNSVTLEFAKEQDRPGLLERISRVFREHQVNLTGIHSVVLGERLQFTISFEQSSASDDVRRALEEMESWPEPMKVLRPIN